VSVDGSQEKWSLSRISIKMLGDEFFWLANSALRENASVPSVPFIPLFPKVTSSVKQHAITV
jgi:hypothetical protein